jgi:hypothetical protein
MKNLLLIIVLFVGLITHETKAQNKTNWVDLGMGIGSSQDHQLHFNGGFNVNWQTPSYFHNAGFNIVEGAGSQSNFTATINYGLGYSFIIKKVLISSISIGPSLSIGEIGGENNSLFFGGAGVSVYAQFFVSPLFFILPEIAVGVEPFINYNFYESRKTNMPYFFGLHIAYNINDNK